MTLKEWLLQQRDNYYGERDRLIATEDKQFVGLPTNRLDAKGSLCQQIYNKLCVADFDDYLTEDEVSAVEHAMDMLNLLKEARRLFHPAYNRRHKKKADLSDLEFFLVRLDKLIKEVDI